MPLDRFITVASLHMVRHWHELCSQSTWRGSSIMPDSCRNCISRGCRTRPALLRCNCVFPLLYCRNFATFIGFLVPPRSPSSSCCFIRELRPFVSIWALLLRLAVFSPRRSCRDFQFSVLASKNLDVWAMTTSHPSSLSSIPLRTSQADGMIFEFSICLTCTEAILNASPPARSLRAFVSEAFPKTCPTAGSQSRNQPSRLCVHSSLSRKRCTWQPVSPSLFSQRCD